ncbi:SusC/RagA family TonB-linked outer membrane protein [Saccharicrinis sp. FJH54]|uniref:SusC/RagA family TonB-linked outer membrane protein n=1 Tax=Saccharicrinis sp. FJH54 TaxID=3344665 RepID=UPI0035D4173A
MTHLRNILSILFLMFGVFYISAQNNDTQESFTVTGTVFNGETMQPIQVASINDANYSSAITKEDGTFSIKVKSYDDILTVTSEGFQTREIILGGRETVDIYLYETGFNSFDQEVRLADYSKPLAYSTHALGIVENKTSYFDASKKGATSAESTFDGKIAGLNVITRDGNPGSGSDLFLRGYSSLNATNKPLVIVDGMIYDIGEYGTPLISGDRSNAFAGIDADDIENITVIKDAAAIYGAKASNGVILITTNHATEQVNQITFSMNGGLNMAPKNIPLMEADDYRIYLNEMLLSAGLSTDSVSRLPFMNNDPSNYDYAKYHNNTDWQKEVFANSYSSNYGVLIKGGDDVALYALSVNYMDYNGTIKNTDFSRFNMRFNSDINISKIFTLNTNISFNYNDRKLKSGSGITTTDNPLFAARIKSPFFYPNQIDGGIITPVLADYDALGVSNPVAIVNEMEQQSLDYRIFGSFNFNVKLSDHLTISDLIGLSFNKSREKVFIPGYGISPEVTEIGIVYNKMMERVLKHSAVNNDFRIRYNNNFNGYHSLVAVAGARLNMNQTEEDWGSDFNSASDQFRTIGQGTARFRNNGGYIGDWNNITYYALGEYAFKKKYFVTVNMALDGSSKFGSQADGIKLHNHQFGFFPSVAGAWLITSEPFMKNVTLLDLFKIRASYGITGNDDIGFYATKKYYTTQRLLAAKGLVRGNIWNPELKWETNKKTNLGVDLALLRNRISLSADYYMNTTDDMLEYIPVEYFTGFDYVLANNGSFNTKGMDLSLNARIINSKLKWDLGITYSKYQTEVTAVNDGRNVTGVYGASILTEVGQQLGVFYGFKTSGVYASQSAAESAGLEALLPNTSTMAFRAGDVIFEDYKADGIIDNQDMQVIGDPTPDFFGSVNTRLQWKAFTLDASLAFSYGNDVFNYLRYQLESMQNFNNQTQAVINRWTYDGQVTSIPKAEFADPIGNSRFSDRWIEDGSYARLRDVTLTYKLPFKANFLKGSEVYVTGINLLTLTEYKGLDPEFSLSNSPLTRGIDVGMTPQVQSFFVGVRVKL